METLTNVQESLTFLYQKEYELWISFNHSKFHMLIPAAASSRPPSDVSFKKNETCSVRSLSSHKDIHFHFPTACQIVFRIFEEKDFPEHELKQLFHLFQPLVINYRQQETLDVILKSVRNISDLNDQDGLLTKILEHALSVIYAANIGVFWMFDKEENVLTARAWAGGPNENLLKIKTKPGEGIVGNTFLDNRSRIYTSYDDIEKASVTMRAENMQELFKSYDFKELKSVITVPISVAEETTGVLIIYQSGPYAMLREDDKKLLEGFSDQVSIILANRKLYSNLQKQNKLLVMQSKIHKTFMGLSLESKGLQNIANKLGELINLPLMIIDFSDHEYYSCRMRKNQWGETDRLSKTFSNLSEPQFQSLFDPSLSFYIHPIIANRSCLGIIMVRAEENKFPDYCRASVEQSSSMIALEMIKKQSVVDFYYKKTHDLFFSFLNSRNNRLLHEKASELGLSRHAHFQAMIIQLIADLHVINVQIYTLISELKLRLQERIAVIYGYNAKITVLFTLRNPEDQTMITKQINQLLRYWHQDHTPFLRIGAGTCYPAFEAIDKSYHEAEKSLAYLLSTNQTGMIQYREIGVNRLFIHQSAEEIDTFIDEVFGSLNANKHQDNHLEKTLIVYMESNLSVSAASKKLHIHVNTMYQRLKKIEELLNVSFSNHTNVLKLQLACYLLRFTNLDDHEVQ
ncbi:helix-turn-helix domain-containing protein [Sporolactobacillus shoreicorticis]|uniref:Helix-turn-helix domain-containing protein n=1 Tax=Sporolactobacillus shoreicorticis TaxID=1923877 RepID=A0ABW5S258_9BACL|nr:helix-turn-helix domain-containing protein [Sporolactobacillus shoreicorticis]MCO7126542.1 helix-turn-helix domain-containing protein [Sporolactobacillus shoreicorticis]